MPYISKITIRSTRKKFSFLFRELSPVFIYLRISLIPKIAIRGKTKGRI